MDQNYSDYLEKGPADALIPSLDYGNEVTSGSLTVNRAEAAEAL